MRFFNDWKSRKRIRSAGQALVLIILTFFGLMFFLGLMIDLGQIFLAKGYLRRAADAASLAAAAQFREGQELEDMVAAAKEVARINGVDDPLIEVQTCKEGIPELDDTLCSPPGEMPKKLVRVTVRVAYPMSFLVLLGIKSIDLVESSVSEAAAMDVVLVIDAGESMSWDKSPNENLNYWEDPANATVCNADNTCEPFKDIKAAAETFATAILNKPASEEQDRLSVITFANGWEAGSHGTVALWGQNWVNDSSVALDPDTGIPSLTVYDPGATTICPFDVYACDGALKTACPATPEDIPTGPCTYAYYSDPAAIPPGTDKYVYGRLNCARVWDVETADGAGWTGKPEAISACTTTNIGGAMRRAGEQFTYNKRLDALWVVVVLTDGAANATFGTKGDLDGSGDNALFTLINPTGLDPEDFIPNLPLGFCPNGTWIGRGTGNNNRMYCQDGDVDDYHSMLTNPELYDADDFARDQTRFVACSATNPSGTCLKIKGQGAIIFTIGLGDEIIDMVDEDPNIAERKPYGGSLLRFMAALGDDGDAATDPCASTLYATGQLPYEQNCGNYFHSPDVTKLDSVFEMIYSRIFTRLTM
jgi:hypothetical protein